MMSQGPASLLCITRGQTLNHWRSDFQGVSSHFLKNTENILSIKYSPPVGLKHGSQRFGACSLSLYGWHNERGFRVLTFQWAAFHQSNQMVYKMFSNHLCYKILVSAVDHYVHCIHSFTYSLSTTKLNTLFHVVPPQNTKLEASSLHIMGSLYNVV